MSALPIKSEVMPTPGSIRTLMDALVQIQAGINQRPEVDGQKAISTYRWRPGQADSPMLYNVLLPSTTQQMDTMRLRDNFSIATRIGGGYSDADQDWETIEAYVDAYRALVDANLWNGQMVAPAMQGRVTWAYRQQIQMFQDTIGGQTVSGIEFQQLLAADRPIR